MNRQVYITHSPEETEAVIVVVPAFSAVILPLVTVATEGSLLRQLTVRPLGVVVAVRVLLTLSCIVMLSWLRETLTEGFDVVPCDVVSGGVVKDLISPLYSFPSTTA